MSAIDDLSANFDFSFSSKVTSTQKNKITKKMFLLISFEQRKRSQFAERPSIESNGAVQLMEIEVTIYFIENKSLRINAY